jgi:hypothetical protein
MTLDEIMEKEKFNEVEKALVKHSMLSQPDRIKLISEIKTAKSNERQSKKIELLTFILAVTAMVDLNFQFVATLNRVQFLIMSVPVLLLIAWGARRLNVE